jgi:predicted Zn-dependent protease
MRVLLALVVAGLLGIAGWVGATIGLPRYHLRAAKQALAQFHPAEANKHLDSCLRRWPNDPEVHLLAARAARLSDDPIGADAQLQECERLEWSSAVALERAMLRAQNGDLDTVEEYLLHQVDDQHPDSIFILDALARGYARVYRFKQAQLCLKLWLDRQPNSIRALLEQGKIWSILHNFQDAADDFRNVLAIDDSCSEARLGLANTLLEMAQPEGALEQLERLRKEQPDNAEVLVKLALCLNWLGHADEALAILNQVLALHPDLPSALQARAQFALEHGDAEEAEQWERKAKALNPYDYQVNYMLYRCLKQCGKQKEAEKQLAEAERIKLSVLRMQELAKGELQSKPDDPAVRTEMGTLSLGLGKDEVGLGWLSSALQKAPDYKPAHAALARYYESNGDKEKAAYHRKKAGG